MPAQLATLICIIFILYLFWEDFKESDESSNALWIPVVWMFFSGSRGIYQWLVPGRHFTTPEAYLEGSPLDAYMFLILSLASVIILIRRRINWAELLINNPWIWMYFLFGFLSILWSDYPFVSLKRWVKALSTISMALIILTDQHPYRAIGVVLRRLAFLLLPLSVLFIKYYPELGRAYTWSGKAMYTGVATQKNGLGQICLISGIYFIYFFSDTILEHWNGRKSVGHPYLIVNFALAATSIWLLYISDSATSILCIIIAAGLFIISRVQAIALKPNRIIFLGMLVFSVFGTLEIFFDVTDYIVSIFGRDPTLTTRVPMWHGLLAMVENPIFGTGYESFWLGDRLRVLWAEYGALTHSHNGYLETYLNLGLIGLAILVGCILSGLLYVRRCLDFDYATAILRLSFIVVVLIYKKK